MKHTFRITMALLAAILVAGAGPAIAAGGKTVSDSRSRAMSMSNPSFPADPAPEYGSLEYEKAMETGTLPPGDAGTVGSSGAETSRGQAPAVDAGGLNYRVGIDTP